MGPKWPKTNSGPKGAQKLILGHLGPRKKYWAGGRVPCAGVRTGGGPPPMQGRGPGKKNPPPHMRGRVAGEGLPRPVGGGYHP